MNLTNTPDKNGKKRKNAENAADRGAKSSLGRRLPNQNTRGGEPGAPKLEKSLGQTSSSSAAPRLHFSRFSGKAPSGGSAKPKANDAEKIKTYPLKLKNSGGYELRDRFDQGSAEYSAGGKYTAVLLDGKKIVKNLIFTALGGIVIILICLTLKLSGGLDTLAGGLESYGVSDAITVTEAGNTSFEEESGNILAALSSAAKFILGFDYSDLSETFKAEIPTSAVVNSYSMVTDASASAAPTTPTPQPSPSPTPAPDDGSRSDIKEINASKNTADGVPQIYLGNETDYGINVEEALASRPEIDMSVEGPKILIVHTHATEAYAKSGANTYDTTESDRSMNTEENVVKVGSIVADLFNSKGIETLHDTELHDYPSFNGSYGDALETTEQYLEKYPSIQIVFDLHRDSIVYDDGTMAKPVTEIDGRKAAQLMFVVGTDANGLYHPNWRNNMTFAIQLQNAINNKYPTLMRYINLRQERFNGHTTNGSLIIEVGSSGNTLDEAIYGMTLAAEVIADYLLSL